MERRGVASSKKKAVAEGYQLFYADEASVALHAHVAHTYALRGHRPLITINTEIKARLYVASAIADNGALVYTVRDKPFDGQAVTEFLTKLLLSQSAAQQKVMVIWDNASIHDCAVTRAFLSSDSQAGRLWLVKQPCYSPHLNADEQVWAQVKGHGLKNTCYHNLAELKPKLTAELEKLKNNPSLVQQFFHHPDLAYY